MKILDFQPKKPFQSQLKFISAETVESFTRTRLDNNGLLVIPFHSLSSVSTHGRVSAFLTCFHSGECTVLSRKTSVSIDAKKLPRASESISFFIYILSLWLSLFIHLNRKGCLSLSHFNHRLSRGSFFFTPFLLSDNLLSLFLSIKCRSRAFPRQIQVSAYRILVDPSRNCKNGSQGSSFRQRLHLEFLDCTDSLFHFVP